MTPERRTGTDRRRDAGMDLASPPYLTRNGFVFRDRRNTPERRLSDTLIELIPIEEIEISEAEL
jgi:hypothetical protein